MLILYRGWCHLGFIENDTISVWVMVIELPEGYYLENFQKLILFVYEQYPDLLTDDEKAFYSDFQDLPLEARYLYTRLISRKGPYFRSDKLNYAEIPNILETSRVLSAAKFIEINPSIDLEWLFHLLLREELLRLDVETPPKWKSLKKPELVQYLLEQENAQGFADQIAQWFSWVEPSRLKELLIYRLCFFGNLYQDLTEFVLLDLGMIHYESYQIQQEDRYFQSRTLLDKTLEMFLLREPLEEVLSCGDAQVIFDFFQRLPHHQDDPTLKRRHNRITNILARQLERLEDLEGALKLYEQAEQPPSRERQARILVKQEKYEGALALCDTMLQAPLTEEEKEFAESFGTRTRKKLGYSTNSLGKLKVHEEILKLDSRPEQFENFPVEAQVATFFESQGHQAFYVENLLWNALFGLTFWKILFMPARGAFFNLYQRGPKGLFSSEFRKERKEQIESQLKAICEDPSWPRTVMETFHKKQGISNYFVHWQALDATLIQLALDRIPRQHFASVFDRMSYDLSNNRTGFPDLIVFPDETLSESSHLTSQHYELVEVKAPGDRLQNNQKRWMKYFNEYGVPYRVVHVKYE